MTQTQYQAMLALFNEFSEDFWLLPSDSLDAFFDILHGRAKPTDSAEAGE